MAAWCRRIVSKHFMQLKNLTYRHCTARCHSVEIQPLQETCIADNNKELQLPDVLKYPDFFEVHKLFTVKDLFDAKVHLGHKMGTLDDCMRQFIFGSRMNTLIIDLDQTAELFQDALNFIAHIAYRDGVILFVGKHQQNSYIIEKTARECGEFSHTRYWCPGTFTNSTALFGIMTRLPDLVIFLNTLNNVFEQHEAVVESSKMLIPTVAVVDTNCNPNLITYPIPGNDDTPESVEFFCRIFKDTILKAKAKRKEMQEKYGSLFPY